MEFFKRWKISKELEVFASGECKLEIKKSSVKTALFFMTARDFLNLCICYSPKVKFQKKKKNIYIYILYIYERIFNHLSLAEI